MQKRQQERESGETCMIGRQEEAFNIQRPQKVGLFWPLFPLFIHKINHVFIQIWKILLDVTYYGRSLSVLLAGQVGNFRPISPSPLLM